MSFADEHLDLAARVLDGFGTPEEVAEAAGCTPAEAEQIRDAAGLDPKTGDELTEECLADSADYLDDSPEWELGIPVAAAAPIKIEPEDPELVLVRQRTRDLEAAG